MKINFIQMFEINMHFFTNLFLNTAIDVKPWYKLHFSPKVLSDSIFISSSFAGDPYKNLRNTC